MRQGFVYGTLCILVGAFLLVGGATNFGNTKVTCNSSEMQPGEFCTESSRRGTERTERSYEEQKAHQDSTRIWLSVGGGAMLLVGIVWFGGAVQTSRKQKRMRQAQAMNSAGAPGGQPTHHR